MALDEQIKESSESPSMDTAVSEEKPYTMADAVEGAFSTHEAEKGAKSTNKKEVSAPPKETPSAREETSGISATPEKKEEASEVPVAKEGPDEETKKAVEFYRSMSNPQFQEMVYRQLEKQFQKAPETAQEAPGSQDDLLLDETLAALDPDVRKAFETLADRKVAALSQKFEFWEKAITEKEQKAAQDQIRREFEEFSSAHKEDLKKYEKPMLELGQKYPDLLRGGKHGLETLLRLVSEEDRISKRVAEEVEKALGHSQQVSEKVKRFSSSHTPATSHSTKGKENYTWEDAFNDAQNKHAVNI